jgi:serine/threonine protein kinase
MLYIPTTTSIRRDCEALHREYEKRGKLGKGAYGEVYQACIAGTKDCGYVLKVITYNHQTFKDSGGSGRSLQTFVDSFVNEVKVFKKLNKKQEKLKLKFSPKLYDYWFCGEGTKVHFYLLIEKYEGDLYHLLKDVKLDQVGKTLVRMTLRVMELSLTIIHEKTHICLNDIKIENILYKQTAPYEYELVFSDFGLSTLNTTEECRTRDREKFKRLIEDIARFEG